MERITWTPELDKQIVECVRMGLSSTKASKVIGVSASALKKRSVRIGHRFRPWGNATEVGVEGHVPADERSGELLRAAGVRI